MNDDIWNSIDNAQLPAETYFGKINFDVWHCVLRKGEGAIPFDPAQHRPDERRTMIHIMITPLTSSNAQFLTERKCLAESKEWVKVTLASIKALGKSARELENKWVRYTMEQTGRTYTDKNGVEKQSTMPKILQVYDSEEAAERARMGENATTSDTDNDTNNTTEYSERKVAEMFLASIVQAADRDRAKVSALLASQPLVSKYFTIDSPEVKALLNES